MTSSKKPRLFYGWYMVMASWAIIFIPTAVAIGVFFKPILEEFRWDRAMLSGVQSMALLAYTIAAPFMGRLVDKIGTRKMLTLSIICQAASTAINGLASSIWHMYIARFIFAFDARHFTKILVSHWFTRFRGTALGIASSAVPLGTLMLTPLSQYLVLTWTWRPTMFFWALVMLAVLLPLIIIIRDNPREKGLSPDGNNAQENKPEQFIMDGNVAPEILAEQTGLNTTEVVRTGSFWLISVTQFICGIGCGFIMTHTVIFATDMGFSDMVGATVMGFNGGLSLIGVLVMGYLSDRIRRNNALGITFLFRSVSFILLIVFVTASSHSLWLLFLAIGFFGFGWYTTAPVTAGVVADLYGHKRMGTILGLSVSCHTLGMALGSYAGGAIYDLTGSYIAFFIIQCPLELAAAIAAFSIRKKLDADLTGCC